MSANILEAGAAQIRAEQSDAKPLLNNGFTQFKFIAFTPFRRGALKIRIAGFAIASDT
ncbi:MAG: hypothetical protein AB7I37_00575 [Pirellulales bacterium]